MHSRWLLARYRRRHLWLGAALAAPLAATVTPIPPGLTPEGLSALGVFAMAVTLWVSGAVPMAVTGMAVLAGLSLTGALPAGEAFALFGNPAVFFILGAFVLAAALMASGLSRRLSLWMLTRFGKGPRGLAGAVLVTSALLSCLMPMHAVAAILFPTLVTIIDALGLQPRRSPLATLLLLSLAWGCSTGGIATLLGGARAPLALGLLQEFSGTSVGFAEWSGAVAPVAAVLLAAAWVVLNLKYRPEVTDMGPAQRLLEREVADAGPWSREEKRVAWVVSATVAAWVFLGDQLGLATLALASTVALFVINAATWPEVERRVNWGVLLMYGGAIALGTALARTGATHWIADMLYGGLPRAPLLFLVVTTCATLVLTEFISNAAAVAVLLPVALSAAGGVGVSPQTITLVVAASSGLAFTLPVGSPPNAIAFSSGYYEVHDVLRAGLWMSTVSAAVVVSAASLLW